MWRIAPESHFYQDIHLFANAKNADMAKRYFLEWTSTGEVAFFSVNKFFLFCEMGFDVGLGTQGGIMIFDPRDMDVALGLLGEYRLPTVNLWLSIDHRCFHQIDSIPIEGSPIEDMYWNKVTLAASSPQFRPGDFRKAISVDRPLSLKEKFAYQVSMSYYVHDLFGWLNPSALSWNVKYALDITCQERYVAARYKGMALVLNSSTGVYFSRNNDVWWNQQLGAAIVSTKGTFGLSFFFNWYVVDQLEIRQNRDRLMLYGINGYN